MQMTYLQDKINTFFKPTKLSLAQILALGISKSVNILKSIIMSRFVLERFSEAY